MKQRKNTKDIVIMVISIITSLAALLILGFIVFYNTRLFTGSNGKIVNDEELILENSVTQSKSEAQITDKIVDNVTEPKKDLLGSESYLLCGLDESELMTDIIMYVYADYDNQKISILQIPRDTYVEKGVSYTGKINSAYNNNNVNATPINRLVSVINDQFKLKVDHYVTVSIDSFGNAVDAIGGIPIDMPYQVGDEEYGIIPKGKQVLDGQKAEWLVRHRHSYYDQDLGRIKVQRLFLASAAEKAKTLGFKQLKNLIPILYGEVTSDMTINEITDVASNFLSVPMESIQIFVVPGENVTHNGQSVWTMHKKETAELLNENFRAYSSYVGYKELPIKELSNTGSFYEDTDDDFNSLISGKKPGQRNER